MITDIIKQAREMLEKCKGGALDLSVEIKFTDSQEDLTAADIRLAVFAQNNLAAILDEVERLRDALAYCAYNPATNKNWNSLDQLIAGINKVNETARKALEGEG